MARRLAAVYVCSAAAGRLGFCVVCPFPFREPVPAAPAATLILHHMSAASGADPIDDRGDDPVVSFFWRRLDSAHSCSRIA
jgi:hypothetical protein